MKKKDFRPIFIVGAPRSGTTLLSVLIDRHSQIAIPPETQFFSEFIDKADLSEKESSSEEMVDVALAFNRIADLNLNREAVLKRFKEYNKTFPNLLRAILEIYGEAKSKRRFGEKSPKHIKNVPEIIASYDKSKIVCIVRDGRDVVRSLLKVNWAEPGNPRRLYLFCMEWSDLAELAKEYAKRYSKERFKLIHYEDLLRNPEKVIKDIFTFIGETYEPSQLDEKSDSNVIPKWESGWKEKASKSLDPSRAEAWRKSKDHAQIWLLNSMMGKMLAQMGYRDNDIIGCPLHIRIKLSLIRIPYLKPMRKLSLSGLYLLRSLGIVR